MRACTPRAPPQSVPAWKFFLFIYFCFCWFLNGGSCGGEAFRGRGPWYCQSRGLNLTPKITDLLHNLYKFQLCFFTIIDGWLTYGNMYFFLALCMINFKSVKYHSSKKLSDLQNESLKCILVLKFSKFSQVLHINEFF